MKNVYSIVLSSDVVEKIDRLAYQNGTNRSNMINQILAEYVSCTTPEMRFREIFDRMQTMLTDGAFKALEPSDTMLSLRSALAYKYNPTVKYSVELYRGERDAIGELRVSLRTQNAGLILYMTEFYQLWHRVETAYRTNITAVACDGKYTRKLVLQTYGDREAVDLGNTIAAYVNVFDRALKTFFYHLDSRAVGAAAVEEIYRAYLAGNRILI